MMTDAAKGYRPHSDMQRAKEAYKDAVHEVLDLVHFRSEYNQRLQNQYGSTLAPDMNFQEADANQLAAPPLGDPAPQDTEQEFRANKSAIDRDPQSIQMTGEMYPTRAPQSVGGLQSMLDRSSTMTTNHLGRGEMSPDNVEQALKDQEAFIKRLQPGDPRLDDAKDRYDDLNAQVGAARDAGLSDTEKLKRVPKVGGYEDEEDGSAMGREPQSTGAARNVMSVEQFQGGGGGGGSPAMAVAGTAAALGALGTKAQRPPSGDDMSVEEIDNMLAKYGNDPGMRKVLEGERNNALEREAVTKMRGKDNAKKNVQEAKEALPNMSSQALLDLFKKSYSDPAMPAAVKTLHLKSIQLLEKELNIKDQDKFNPKEKK